MECNNIGQRNGYSDRQLIECYLKFHSQHKAAEVMGVSRETVARAVRRAGISLDGRKYNGVRGGQQKITDEDLIAESKTMTRDSIAEKYGMNIVSIDKRLHRLGIHCVKKQVVRSQSVHRQSVRPSDVPVWHYVESQGLRINQRHREFSYVSTRGQRIRLKCLKCGAIVERAASTVRQKGIECEYCKSEKQLFDIRCRFIQLLLSVKETKTPKICVACGNEFFSPYPTQKYCSPKCKALHKRGQRKRCKHYGVYYDPDVTRIKVVQRDHCICQICGKKCDPKDRRWGSSGPNFPTLDHIIPLAKGGTHTWDNVQCACGICNSSKRDLITV